MEVPPILPPQMIYFFPYYFFKKLGTRILGTVWRTQCWVISRGDARKRFMKENYNWKAHPNTIYYNNSLWGIYLQGTWKKFLKGETFIKNLSPLTSKTEGLANKECKLVTQKKDSSSM